MAWQPTNVIHLKRGTLHGGSMRDLTANELKLLATAGRRLLPGWLIWLPALLGGVGGSLMVAAALVAKAEPDLRGVAYGLTVAGFLLSMSAMTASNQALSSLIAELRERLVQSTPYGGVT